MLRVFTDPRCLLHALPRGFPESSDRLALILNRLRAEGREIEEAASHGGAETAVLGVHSEEYVERFRRAMARGDGLLDSADNPLSPGTWQASVAAVEVLLSAADWVVAGEARSGFAAVRPPGHHAERAMAMGFCYFNNIAVAAEYLRAEHGVARIAIIDFDVHHGNGTQHVFEDRADIFFASAHQYPFYPGTGAAEERGVGAGDGTTLNAPLPARSGDQIYRRVLRELILPEIRHFAPEVLLVSAGFDVWLRDPLGGMAVTAEAFGDWGRWLGELADEICQGRLLATLEGGYDLEALPGLVSAHLSGLDG